MNKIFNKLFWVMAVCGLTMTACSDDIDGIPVLLPMDKGLLPFESIKQYNADRDVWFFRGKCISYSKFRTSTTQITVTPGENAAGIFTVPTEVSFADGVTEAKITVTYQNMKRDVPILDPLCSGRHFRMALLT